MSSLLRRVAVCAAVVVSVLMVGALPASAGTARVDYVCGSVGMIVPVTFDVTVTPPATAVRGQTAPVSATVKHTTYPVTAPVAAGYYQATLVVALDGAGAETVQITLTNPALATGEYLRYSGTAQLTFPTAGTVEYRPDRFWRSAMGCILRYPNTVPVLATTQVS